MVKNKKNPQKNQPNPTQKPHKTQLIEKRNF